MPATNLANRVCNPALQVQEAVVTHTASNLTITAIKAELRVQGDPSFWLCTPRAGMGRTVGVIFINPFFLNPGKDVNDCPVWAAADPADPNATVCNKMLTNKSWWIYGVDHQIRDGQYVTTIDVVLPSPSAEINANVKNLGGDPCGGQVITAGEFCNLDESCEGDEGTSWKFFDDDGEFLWVGGGEEDNGYTEVPA